MPQLLPQLGNHGIGTASILIEPEIKQILSSGAIRWKALGMKACVTCKAGPAAEIARAQEAAVATCNTSDDEDCGIELIDPWHLGIHQ